MAITKNDIIGDVLDQHPETAQLFLSIGTALAAPLHAERPSRKPAWFTERTLTRSLRRSTRQ